MRSSTPATIAAGRSMPARRRAPSVCRSRLSLARSIDTGYSIVYNMRRPPARAQRMAGGTRVVRNLYRDSVSLMQLSNALSALPGIVQASVVMATEANLALLRAAGLARGALQAGPNDLLIALEGKTEQALAAAFQHAESALRAEPAQSSNGPAA